MIIADQQHLHAHAPVSQAAAAAKAPTPGAPPAAAVAAGELPRMAARALVDATPAAAVFLHRHMLLEHLLISMDMWTGQNDAPEHLQDVHLSSSRNRQKLTLPTHFG